MGAMISEILYYYIHKQDTTKLYDMKLESGNCVTSAYITIGGILPSRRCCVGEFAKRS